MNSNKFLYIIKISAGQNKFGQILLQFATETLLNLTKALKPNGYFFLIEDKAREEYLKFFRKTEDGMFFISKERDFAKYYFIGQNKG